MSNITIKVIIICSFSLLFAVPIDKISVNTFFNTLEKQKVLKGEIISKAFLKYNGSIHSQNTDDKIIIPITKYTDKILSGYEMICVEKCFFHFTLTGKSRLMLYDLLADPSKMSGMRYYSATDKRIQPFIMESTLISSPTKRQHINADIHTVIKSELIQYFKITDNRFGELVFRSELYNEGNNFILRNVCVQPMKKYLVSINRKEEYQLISFFLYDKNFEGYFYYSVNAMRIRSEMFLTLGILRPESFGNRIRAGTVHFAGFLGLDWKHRLKAFE